MEMNDQETYLQRREREMQESWDRRPLYAVVVVVITVVALIGFTNWMNLGQPVIALRVAVPAWLMAAALLMTKVILVERPRKLTQVYRLDDKKAS